MGVFSATNRRLTATGTIKFTPDARAAVELTFTIENAWQIDDGIATLVPSSKQTFTNFTVNEGYNPIVSATFAGPNDGKIQYNNLRFNPGATEVSQADITLTFKITNYSAKSENMRVTFASTTGNGKLLEDGTPMGYTIISGLVNKQAVIEKTEPVATTATIIIKLKVSDLTKTYQPLNFDFSLTFDFV